MQLLAGKQTDTHRVVHNLLDRGNNSIRKYTPFYPVKIRGSRQQLQIWATV